MTRYGLARPALDVELRIESIRRFKAFYSHDDIINFVHKKCFKVYIKRLMNRAVKFRSDRDFLSYPYRYNFKYFDDAERLIG